MRVLAPEIPNSRLWPFMGSRRFLELPHAFSREKLDTTHPLDYSYVTPHQRMKATTSLPLEGAPKQSNQVYILLGWDRIRQLIEATETRGEPGKK